VLQYDIHPFVGCRSPITFLIVVLGGLGNFVGASCGIRGSPKSSRSRLFSDLDGLRAAFAFFIVMMFIRPAGLLARRS